MWCDWRVSFFLFSPLIAFLWDLTIIIGSRRVFGSNLRYRCLCCGAPRFLIASVDWRSWGLVSDWKFVSLMIVSLSPSSIWFLLSSPIYIHVTTFYNSECIASERIDLVGVDRYVKFEPAWDDCRDPDSAIELLTPPRCRELWDQASEAYESSLYRFPVTWQRSRVMWGLFLKSLLGARSG